MLDISKLDSFTQTVFINEVSDIKNVLDKEIISSKNDSNLIKLKLELSQGFENLA